MRVLADIRDDSESEFAERFHQLHQPPYTFRLENTKIELVNFRVASAADTSVVPGSSAISESISKAAPIAERTVAFAIGAPTATPIYHRPSFSSGFQGLVRQLLKRAVLQPSCCLGNISRSTDPATLRLPAIKPTERRHLGPGCPRHPGSVHLRTTPLRM